MVADARSYSGYSSVKRQSDALLSCGHDEPDQKTKKKQNLNKTVSFVLGNLRIVYRLL